MTEYQVLALANQSMVIHADTPEEAVEQARQELVDTFGEFEFSHVSAESKDDPNDWARWSL